jgi:hypothetical protein
LDNLTKNFFWSGRDDPKMFQYNLVKGLKNTESILFFQRMTTNYYCYFTIIINGCSYYYSWK